MVVAKVLLGVPHYATQSTQAEEAWKGPPDKFDSGKPLLLGTALFLFFWPNVEFKHLRLMAILLFFFVMLIYDLPIVIGLPGCGNLNYEESVVYRHEAVLPTAVVTYSFTATSEY